MWDTVGSFAVEVWCLGCSAEERQNGGGFGVSLRREKSKTLLQDYQKLDNNGLVLNVLHYLGVRYSDPHCTFFYLSIHILKQK